MDIFVTRGAWLAEAGKIPNSLLMNKAGVFYDVSYSAGIRSSLPTQVSAWGDVNNDGCIDLFIGNESYYSELYINECNGTFVERSRDFNIIHSSFVKGASWGDVNNDGWIDLYISSYGEKNRLLINKGENLGFYDSNQTDILTIDDSFSTWFFDFNNDGYDDLFVAGFISSFYHLLTTNDDVENYMKAGIYINQKNNEFKYLSNSKTINSMGANFGDINGDGFLDYYLGVGAPVLIYLQPNNVYLNIDGRDVADITYQSGLGHLQKGHGVSFADIDSDGDMDIYLVNGGWAPVDTFPNSLFINQAAPHHWITLKLVGVQSNRAAIGARIKLTLKRPNGSTRYIFRTVSAGGSFGGSPFQETIAFSNDQLIKIDIQWPSKQQHSFDFLDINSMYEINESGSIRVIQTGLLYR